VIAVPTGVKIFNWIATLWRGTIEFRVALLYAVGGIGTFVIGGITGIFLAVFTVDWQLTDTYFVVAHMHYVAFGGSAFAMFSALYYWFPKLTGRMLSEGIGKVAFWLTLIGFQVTFLVQHSAGLSGMPRRIFEYSSSSGWHAYNLISTIGAFIIALGVLLTIINVVRSLKHGAIAGPDPWKANTLEWFTPSPPPEHNFDAIPRVRSVEPMKDYRRQVEELTGSEQRFESTPSSSVDADTCFDRLCATLDLERSLGFERCVGQVIGRGPALQVSRPGAANSWLFLRLRRGRTYPLRRHRTGVRIRGRRTTGRSRGRRTTGRSCLLLEGCRRRCLPTGRWQPHCP